MARFVEGCSQERLRLAVAERKTQMSLAVVGLISMEGQHLPIRGPGTRNCVYSLVVSRSARHCRRPAARKVPGFL